jgi:hypothetical protein
MITTNYLSFPNLLQVKRLVYLISFVNAMTIVNFCEVIHVQFICLLIDSLREELPTFQEWKQFSMELILLFLLRIPNLVFVDIVLSNTFV